METNVIYNKIIDRNSELEEAFNLVLNDIYNCRVCNEAITEAILTLFDYIKTKREKNRYLSNLVDRYVKEQIHFQDKIHKIVNDSKESAEVLAGDSDEENFIEILIPLLKGNLETGFNIDFSRSAFFFLDQYEEDAQFYELEEVNEASDEKKSTSINFHPIFLQIKADGNFEEAIIECFNEITFKHIELAIKNLQGQVHNYPEDQLEDQVQQMIQTLNARNENKMFEIFLLLDQLCSNLPTIQTFED